MSVQRAVPIPTLFFIDVKLGLERDSDRVSKRQTRSYPIRSTGGVLISRTLAVEPVGG